jgi:cathepsin A (carboxypeptidase C)
MGPASIDGNTTKINKHSWTNKSNMLFIDSPINVGFSYGSHGASVATTEETAVDVHAFLSIFIESFSEFKGRPVHLSSESYGGRYLPIFGTEIVHQNELLKKSNSSHSPINLNSM